MIGEDVVIALVTSLNFFVLIEGSKFITSIK